MKLGSQQNSDSPGNGVDFESVTHIKKTLVSRPVPTENFNKWGQIGLVCPHFSQPSWGQIRIKVEFLIIIYNKINNLTKLKMYRKFATSFATQVKKCCEIFACYQYVKWRTEEDSNPRPPDS